MCGQSLAEILADIPAQEEHIDNGPLLESSGLRTVHIRKGVAHRDMTVAYKPRHSNQHNLQVSTTITNPSDTFSRKLGTRTAIENFQDGETINLPAVGGLSDVHLIQFYFDPLATYLRGVRS